MSTKLTRKSFIGRTSQKVHQLAAITDPILYVAIDVAKYFHKAVIFDLSRKILEQPFGFDLSSTGFNKLVEKIELHAEQQKIKQIVIGMEATGHYYESLVEHLKAKGYSVFLFNPYATFKTRALRLDYVSTDAIDAKAIGEALLLGKGNEVVDEPGVYKHLKLLTRFRRAKNQARQVLKNQMLRDLDRIWPGLMKNSTAKGLGLFTNLWESAVARKLLKLNWLPQDIAKLTATDLVNIYRQQEIKGIGRGWATKIINHAAKVLPCNTSVAKIHQRVIQINLKLLEEIDELISQLDGQINDLLQQTPGTYLLSIQGISSVTAAEFLAEIGDPAKYSNPGEWIKLAGLNASCSQSGTYNRKDNPLAKTGRRYLRSTAFTIARNISRWEPFFINYRDKFLAKGKPILKVYGAVANKFIRVSFYMLLRKVNFDPDYEKKKGEKGLT